MKLRALIKDGVIQCASQVCTDTCQYWLTCKEYTINASDWKVITGHIEDGEFTKE